jgi:dTDP-4-amino-4,6-dideoxygalactose transaminase
MQKVPFFDLVQQYQNNQESIDSAIHRVISEAAFIGGTYVRNFEKQFAEFYGVKHVISCANGTDSLYIIMKMLGIGQGDEVITVANSWISSSETITQTGATPVFVDVDPTYYSINEALIEEKITSRTKAIIAVHLQGQMCRIDFINDICERHGIYLIEDCAQSHLSEYKGVRAGLTGIAGSFSFYPGKNLGAYGDAGCITTNNDELAQSFKMYANHGALVKHHHQMEGINSRMDALQASVLTAKLPLLNEWTRRRIELAGIYNSYLKSIAELVLPTVRPDSMHTFHLYVVRAKKRDQLMEFLKNQGIEVAIHYPTALPNLPAYQYLGNKPSDFPVATLLQSEILSLPIYPELTESQIAYVAESIKKFYHQK